LSSSCRQFVHNTGGSCPRWMSCPAAALLGEFLCCEDVAATRALTALLYRSHNRGPSYRRGDGLQVIHTQTSWTLNSSFIVRC